MDEIERKAIWSASHVHSFEFKKSALPAPPGFRGELVLFKLHGSLDWYRDRTGNVTCLPHPPRDPLEAVALYPAETKLIFQDPYFTSFMYFDECLRNARFLVVIGYSFADAALRERVRSALSTNRELKVAWFGRDAEELDLKTHKLKSIPYPLGWRTKELVSEIRTTLGRATEAEKPVLTSIGFREVVVLKEARVPFQAGQKADFRMFDVSKASGFRLKIPLPKTAYWRAGFVLAPPGDQLQVGDATSSIVNRFLFHIGQGYQNRLGELPKKLHLVAYGRGERLTVSWRGVKARTEDLEFEWAHDHFLIDAKFVRATGELQLSVGAEGFREDKKFPVETAYFSNLFLLGWADGVMPFEITMELYLKN